MHGVTESSPGAIIILVFQMRTCRFAEELAQSGSHQWPRWDLDPESVVGAPTVNHCAKDPRGTEVGGVVRWDMARGQRQKWELGVQLKADVWGMLPLVKTGNSRRESVFGGEMHYILETECLSRLWDIVMLPSWHLEYVTPRLRSSSHLKNSLCGKCHHTSGN